MNYDENLYELEYPAPISPAEYEQGLNLIVALQGYADSGNAVANASNHLRSALENKTYACFDIDGLLDYRSRRPTIVLDNHEVIAHESLDLNVYAQHDHNKTPFLLLSGPEPDLHWHAFSHAVLDIAQEAGVTQIICLYAAPMTVPHTRPLIVSAHGSPSEKLTDFHTWDSRMIIPGSASLEIELLAAKRGLGSIGLTAHVPHYIASSDYPEATVRLLEGIQKVGDLSFPLGTLRADTERINQQLHEQVEDSHEIAAVVSALEQQYDEELARYRRRLNNSLLAPGEAIPSGDELGAEFEKFLADVSPETDSENSQDPNSESDDE